MPKVFQLSQENGTCGLHVLICIYVAQSSEKATQLYSVHIDIKGVTKVIFQKFSLKSFLHSFILRLFQMLGSG